MQFGCKAPTYDSRDYKLKTEVVSDSTLPEEYILPIKSEVKNQHSVNSCVAHATSSVLEYHSDPYQKLSTNFIYGIQRKLFNVETHGMLLRDACKIAADYGDMLEEDCPGNNEIPECYSVAEDSMADANKLQRASEYRIAKYFLCLTNNDIKYAIYKHGPVLASIKWYPKYKVNHNGILEGERKGRWSGHAVMVYGYNKDGFICQNSWGSNWGINGSFVLPYNVKFMEARGFVDWDGESELKKPSTGSIWNILYKALNGLVNLVYKLLRKNNET